MSEKFAVVTGGSNGIGLELAKLFAQNGFDLLIAARNQPKLDRAASQLRSFGALVDVVSVDLATPDGVEKLVSEIHATNRPVDAIAINAGHGLGGRFVDGTHLDEEIHLIQLNVISVVHLAKRVLPEMVKRGQGRVLFTGSISGTTPVPFEAVYGASKAFVNSFSQALRSELKDSGVTVTVLMPNATETDFFHRAHMDDTEIGSGKKEDPAYVARQGFEAMMAGKDSVFGGGLKTQFQGRIVNTVLPEAAKARLIRHRSEPGSANH